MRSFLLVACIQPWLMSAFAMTRVKEVTLEHYRETLGIGAPSPHISWKIETDVENWTQKGYEVEIIWGDNQTEPTRSGLILTDQSVLVSWPGRPLKTAETARVRVRVTGNDDSDTDWSAALVVEAGLLSPGDWKGSLIEGPQIVPDGAITPVRFRKYFNNSKAISKARLYITARGLYEAYINDLIIGDHVLAPGWTAYQHELQYQTYDVTEYVRSGDNVLGIYVAEGWYAGRLGADGNRYFWGNKPAVMAQLVLSYEDGSVDKIGSDASWSFKVGGPVTRGEIYDGEDFDARIPLDFSDGDNSTTASWDTVHVTDHDTIALRAPDGPPIRRVEEVKAVSSQISPKGRLIIDFGQNLVGWLKVSVNGPAGHQITFTHAEVLENGEIGIRPLRTAKQTDRLTLSGEGSITWSPRFTFHGFRYVEITNWPTEEINLHDIHAEVIHTDMKRTGDFACSNGLINKLHQNILWSMKGNFVGIPTDCPQRDERFGWTGDIQAFAPTASFLYDCSGLLKSWLRNLAAEQGPGGIPPLVSPDALPGWRPATAIWGDAAVHVPYSLYLATGDVGILTAQLESMLAWIETGVDRSVDFLWNPTGFQFGDWLDPAAPPGEADRATTDKHLVADAFLVASTDIMVQIATILRKPNHAFKFLAQASELRRAFARRYTLGNPMQDSQTAYALAIQFDLFPSEAHKEAGTTRLVDLIKHSSHYKIATGFAGTPIIGPALTKINETHLFYRMLNEKKCPSWLYPVTMNATTIWERWDSMMPDGSINPGSMTSFNHYALGSVADWMHGNIGGLKILEAGWKRFSIKPVPGGDLIWAKTNFESPYGLISSSWEVLDGIVTLNFVVPPNAQAEVALPGKKARVYGSGRYSLTAPFLGADGAEQGQWEDSNQGQKVIG